jgi:predicted flap endonuclease-1-like 5' DNA nuclease
MSPELAAKLKEERITNTDHLLEAAMKPGPRRELAKKVGVSPSELLEYINRADLARIRGIGDVFANLLEDAGVDSVKELARRRPDHLHEALLKANEASQRVGRVPNVEMITGWIDEAKRLRENNESVQD